MQGENKDLPLKELFNLKEKKIFTYLLFANEMCESVHNLSNWRRNASVKR